MLAGSQEQVDAGIGRAFDRVGLVGSGLRERLRHDLTAKVVLRGAADGVALVGPRGSGRSLLAEAAHAVGAEVLGRPGRLVEFDCGLSHLSQGGLERALRDASRQAAEGTLVVEGVEALGPADRRVLTRTLEAVAGDALVLTPTEPGASRGAHARTEIHVRALHEREDDVWELIDHFFASTVEALAAPQRANCRGFTRQARADIFSVVQETSLASVRQLRDLIRDVIYEALADGPLPLKLTSELVQPVLERAHGSIAARRRAVDAELVAGRFDDLARRSLAARLAEIHGVPVDLLQRQAAIIEEVVGAIDGVPRSYRNILDKAEDIERAALWLVTGASTQAEFRRFFGEERFMRPTKSVAWAFYNRVFKRDPGA